MNYFATVLSAERMADSSVIKLITDPVAADDISKYGREASVTAELRLNDGRTITSEQRKKIYATIKDISYFTGDVPEYLKYYLKFDFCACNELEYFSLSDCSVSIAKEFINYLIELCIAWDIPLSDMGVDRTDDIDKYLYYCLKYRRCAITGAKGADIHHCTGSRVGMGGNRNKIDNRHRKLIALSREWHTKVHAEGEDKIFNSFHVYGIEVDESVLRDLGLSVKDIS